MKSRLVIIAFSLSTIMGCGGGGSEPTPSDISNSDLARSVDNFTYKFDETGGSTATNSDANFFNGIIYGASRVPGKVGNALHFGTTGARVEIRMYDINSNGQWYSIPFDTNTISMDAWVKLDSLGTNAIYQIVGSGYYGVTSFRFQVNNSKLEFLINDGYTWRSVIIGNQILSPNDWHHAAITYDGTIATTYIDGEVDKTNNITFMIPTNYNTLYIGNYDNDVNASLPFQHQFLGTIDELRVSKSLRSAAELSSYYHETK